MTGTDAVQALGKLPLDVRRLDVDLSVNGLVGEVQRLRAVSSIDFD